MGTWRGPTQVAEVALIFGDFQDLKDQNSIARHIVG